MNILFNKLCEDFDRLELMFDDIRWYYQGSMEVKRFISMSRKERNQFLNKLELRCLFMLSKIREIREKSEMLEDDTYSQ